MFDNFVVPDLLPAAPELFLATMALVILMADLFVKDSRRTVIFALTQLSLLGCAVIQYTTMTGEITFTFSNMFVDDLMSDLLKVFLYMTVMLVLFYSRGYILDREPMAKGEFYVLALFATLGMMVMISANHFLTIYLGLELLSLSLYAMVAMNRDSVVSTEAAMKYFVLGALASGLLLYGMSMIYGGTGTLTIADVAREVARLPAGGADRSFLVFGTVFLVAGLAFKLGVVPFHMWLPDVYHGAPTPVTLFLSAGPKLAAFAMAVRLLVNGLPTLAHDWQQMLALLAVLSMALGNIAAIAQSNLKRMLAYSAIAHMGFMLLGLLSGWVDGNWNSRNDAYSAALFYVLVYAVMSVGAFGMLLYLSRAGFDCETLDDLKGLNRRSPWYAFLMMLIMFSLAGIPPTAGFYAKLAVISAAVSAGHLWLAVAAVMLSLVGAYYYLRVVKLMYFDEPADAAPVAGHPGPMRLVLAANGLGLLLIGVLPQPLMSLCFAAMALL